MADTLPIQSLFEKETNVLHQERGYISKDFVTVPDLNMGVYAGNNIKFLTSRLTATDLFIYRDSFLEIPMRLTSPTTYTAQTRLALKSSVLSLISGLIVAHAGNNASLVNEISGSTGILSSLKLCMESSFDFIKSSGSQLHFYGLDSLNQITSSGVETYSSAYPPNTIITPAMILNPLTNKALFNRISIIETKHNVSAYQLLIMIPLRLIHSLFDTLDFPIDNMPLRIEFQLSNVSNNGQAAFCNPVYGLDSALTVLSGSPVSVPLSDIFTSGSIPHTLAVGQVITFIPAAGSVFPVAIGWAPATSVYVLASNFSATTFQVSLTSGGAVLDFTVASTGTYYVQTHRNFASVAAVHPDIGACITAGLQFTDRNYAAAACNLLLCRVQLNDTDLKKLIDAKASKTEKLIQYTVSDFYMPTVGSTLGTINQDIASGALVCPQRLYAMVPATGTLSSMNNTFPGYIGVNNLYNTNIIINNGAALYQSDISNPRIQYSMLEDVMLGNGESPAVAANISYECWKNGWGVYVFDLSRYKNNGTENVNIRLKAQCGTYSADPLNGTMGAPVSYDLIVITERLVSMVLKRSDSAPTMISVRDGDKFAQ